MIYLQDMHLHSHYSEDSSASVMSMTDAAYKKGLGAIAFTDHVEDCNRFEPLNYPVDDFFKKREALFADVEAAKEKYSGKMDVLTGVELGGTNHDTEKAKAIASTDGLDFIIGSVHNLSGRSDIYHWNYTSLSECRDIMEEYFSENIAVAKLGYFDVIGHLGYPSRYMFAKGFDVRVSEYPELLSELYRVLIESGKGIELNTAGFKKAIGDSAPDFKALKLYKELGGEIITVGSDSHEPELVGYSIERGTEMLLEAGFKYVAVFRERKPRLIKINGGN